MYRRDLLTLLVVSNLWAAPARAARTHEVRVQSNSYVPAVVNMVEGDSVRWTNSGGLHNVQADTLVWRCANGCDGEGGDGNPSGTAWVVTRTFNEAGMVRYHCDVHGGGGGLGMAGILNILPAAIFADDFELGNTAAWSSVVGAEVRSSPTKE